MPSLAAAMMSRGPDRIFRRRIPSGAIASLLLALILLAAVIPASLHAETTAEDTAVSAAYADTDTAALPTGAGAATDVTAVAPKAAAAQPPTPAAPQPQAWIDITAPVFTSVAPANGSLNGPAISVTANFSDAEPSSGIAPGTVMIHIDGRHQSACSISGSSITCTKSGLSDGQHSLEAFVCDGQFNCSSLTWSIAVDATPPVISGLAPSGTVNTSALSLGSLFSDGAGSGIDPASASVSLDGLQMQQACQLTVTGATCAVAGLTEGRHDVQIGIADTMGNRSQAAWSFIVNTGSIGITGQRPAHGSWQRTASPPLGAVFQAAGIGQVDPGSVRVLLDGADRSDMFDCRPDGIDSGPSLEELEDGWHTLSVSVNDDLGHDGLAQWEFGVDTVPPTIGQLQPAGTASRQATVAAAFVDDGSGISISSVRLTLDGADYTDSANVTPAGIAYAPSHPFSAGGHQVQLTVEDLAGNRQTTAWSFAIAPESSVPASPTAPASTSRALLTYYSTGTNPLQLRVGAGWMIAGLNAFTRQYHLPWSGAAPRGGASSGELVIRNLGAGEAQVRVLSGGREEWQTSIPAGEARSWDQAAAAGGPLKIISSSGQKLEVIQRVPGAGSGSETRAVSGEELEPVLLLPWHEALPVSQGRAELVLANPGSLPAEADVYLGDPAIAESLVGHFSIGPDSAVRAALPAVSGGPIQIICTTPDQPLVAGLERSVGEALTRDMATGFSRLLDRYQFKAADRPDDGTAQLQLGNANGRDVRVEVRVDGKPLADPDSGDETWNIARYAARTVALSGSWEEVETICLDCGPGEGLTAGISS